MVTFVTLTQETNSEDHFSILFLILFISLEQSQLLVFYFNGTELKFGSTCCLIPQQWMETGINLAFSGVNVLDFCYNLDGNYLL